MTDQTPTEQRLRGDLTIFEVAGIAEALRAVAAEAERLHLDLSEVGEVDTAGVQLLLSLERELSARGATLRVVGRPAALAEALERLGLAPWPTRGGEHE